MNHGDILEINDGWEIPNAMDFPAMFD